MICACPVFENVLFLHQQSAAARDAALEHDPKIKVIQLAYKVICRWALLPSICPWQILQASIHYPCKLSCRFLHASSIQAGACCILTQLLEWNSVSTFFQSKCVNITNWKYSFQFKGKAAVVTLFFFISSMSRQKDLQRRVQERSCKVSHLIINRNHFFGGWYAAENWQSKFIFALCASKLIPGLRRLKFHWLL